MNTAKVAESMPEGAENTAIPANIESKHGLEIIRLPAEKALIFNGRLAGLTLAQIRDRFAEDFPNRKTPHLTTIQRFLERYAKQFQACLGQFKDIPIANLRPRLVTLQEASTLVIRKLQELQWVGSSEVGQYASLVRELRGVMDEAAQQCGDKLNLGGSGGSERRPVVLQWNIISTHVDKVINSSLDEAEIIEESPESPTGERQS